MKRDKYDKVVSDLVRESQSYICEACGADMSHHKRACHASHFKSRSIKWLRYSIYNVSCHCAACHKKFSEQPDLHTEWFNNKSRLAKALLANDIPINAVDYLNTSLIYQNRLMLKLDKFQKDGLLSHYKEELEMCREWRDDGNIKPFIMLDYFGTVEENYNDWVEKGLL